MIMMGMVVVVAVATVYYLRCCLIRCSIIKLELTSSIGIGAILAGNTDCEL